MCSHYQKLFTEQNKLAQWGVTHSSYWTLSKHAVWIILGDWTAFLTVSELVILTRNTVLTEDGAAAN
jgi:hypothetical protein